MEAMLIYTAYAAIILTPVILLIRYLRYPSRPTPLPTISALLYLRRSLIPLILYAALFLLLAIAETLGSITLISRTYEHSLLLAIALDIPWALLLTLIVLAIATKRYRHMF